jgi:predicted dehydrogenase
MTTIGVVGLNYWGPNLVRNFNDIADLTWLCDLDEAQLQTIGARYPKARTTSSFDELLADDTLDAVVIATPVPTHYALAKQALEAGKHVFVEKPPAMRAAEMDELVSLAVEQDRVLMPGHLLLYHPGVLKVKDLIDRGELGDVLCVYGNRVNLGIVRSNENALWSLGVHDVSVVLHLLGDDPDEVSARGECYVRPNVQDVVFGYIHFSTGQIGHLHLSWLDPDKMRKMTVVGTRKMAVFDDMEPDRKVTVHDKGEIQMPEGRISTHTGDIWSPRIDMSEPLKLECEHFLNAVRTGEEPRTGVEEGVRVVEVLEAMQRSLERGGETISLAAATR